MTCTQEHSPRSFCQLGWYDIIRLFRDLSACLSESCFSFKLDNLFGEHPHQLSLFFSFCMFSCHSSYIYIFSVVYILLYYIICTCITTLNGSLSAAFRQWHYFCYIVRFKALHFRHYKYLYKDYVTGFNSGLPVDVRRMQDKCFELWDSSLVRQCANDPLHQNYITQSFEVNGCHVRHSDVHYCSLGHRVSVRSTCGRWLLPG